MKLLHIADLHIGKRVNAFSMIEDQAHILKQILRMIDAEKPDGVLIAGDIYDRSQPPVEAVELLDTFLTELTASVRSVFMISGNHDSPERLSFGRRIMRKNGLHIAGVFAGVLQKVGLTDAHGAVNIYLLPFLKPAMAKPFFEQPIESYDEAVRAIISSAKIDERERNILLTHQFVVNGAWLPARSESESLSVGGLENVDLSAFAPFDYVAAGHLHKPQKIGRDTVRYAGSPLKYSFSEARHQKSAALLELGAKGDEIPVRLLPLIPLRDLREIKGPIAELLRIGREEASGAKDYIHATLTDEADIYDAIGQLRLVYPNLMTLDFENSRVGRVLSPGAAASDAIAEKSPLDLFAAFYQMQNNNELNPEQVRVMERIFARAAGGAEE
ncbi:MAG: exonuclease SbcCD subunit D [Clostridiales Family XIII bacterium]|jgi:exonuclease SbcD|nr:exonuclease SbcCD subunit D [Clostridiales Family XIII bacterium]